LAADYYVTMLLDRLLTNLELTLRPFVVCEVATGWRLRLGRLDWVTVHFVLAGSGRLRSSTGRMQALPRHSLALVGPGQAHAIEIGDPVEHEATATRPRARQDQLDVYEAGPHDPDELLVACGRLQARYESGQGLFDGLDEPLVLDFTAEPEMASVFERMLAEERRRSSTSPMMMSALMSEALILLFRRLCAEPECPLPWLTPLEDPRFSAPLALMLEHPEREHTVESLAAASSMSRTAFAAAFKDSFASSPMAYLRGIRLRRAAALLHEGGLTVDDVATRSGYASRSQFSRAFSAQFGVSPSGFRSTPPTA
jgi:AraC family transcriptional activator of mtrCDE